MLNRVINRRYKLVRRLHKGGFGIIYEAWDRAFSPSRHVVLKFPIDDKCEDDLIREVKIARKLEHPNICKYEGPLKDRRPPCRKSQNTFLAIEHGGRSLESIIEDKGSIRYTEKEVFTVLTEIADALDHCVDYHRIVHGDVSPSNILVDCAGVARLTDFGLSTRLNKDLVGPVALGMNDYYAAPEVQRNRETMRYSDQYSLAIVALDLLTWKLYHSKRRYRGNNPAVKRALSVRPGDRYETCTEFILELKESLRYEKL